ncbi:MAG TPA: glycosyltransferase family 39 protein, partial [Chloroflexia bacterium]|nr:glycosyltransferase family 39 protein [Chloroflexia bacterium]
MSSHGQANQRPQHLIGRWHARRIGNEHGEAAAPPPTERLAASMFDELDEANVFAVGARSSLLRVSGEGRATSRSGSPRYVGRSARHPEGIIGPTGRTGKTPSTPLRLPVEPQPAPVRRFRAPTLPWSGRLVAALCVLLLATLAFRLISVPAPVVDSPSGVQATHAAYVKTLAGQLTPATEQGGLLVGSPPWTGVAPANPLAGLPVYHWLSALGLSLPVPVEWFGRSLSALFSVLGALALFATVRRTAGSLAAVYATLFFAVSPLSAALGQQFSPAALILAMQALAVLALLSWRDTVSQARVQGSTGRFLVAITVGGVAALLDPGSIFLAVPAAYLVLSVDGDRLQGRVTRRTPRATADTWSDAWHKSAHRGKVLVYAAMLVIAAGGWWLYSSKVDTLVLGSGDGAGSMGGLVANLFNYGTYVQLVGLTIGRVLSVAGLLLLGAGVLQGARQGTRGLFNLWLAAGLVHALLDAGRLSRHEDVLLPLILPACALVGIGASWAGSLPARVWRAINEQQREPA